ncbi:MAG: hypothetical protein CMP39_03775 [Rickettsiales bacterium]|nr:hypothetical protein [Rickettsiales bacterium]|tara:strand:- start:3200 stop:4054 length:855 start_codon:yes stop_codon:yes gene_type:complete
MFDINIDDNFNNFGNVVGSRRRALSDPFPKTKKHPLTTAVFVKSITNVENNALEASSAEGLFQDLDNLNAELRSKDETIDEQNSQIKKLEDIQNQYFEVNTKLLLENTRFSKQISHLKQNSFENFSSEIEEKSIKAFTVLMSASIVLAPALNELNESFFDTSLKRSIRSTFNFFIDATSFYVTGSFAALTGNMTKDSIGNKLFYGGFIMCFKLAFQEVILRHSIETIFNMEKNACANLESTSTNFENTCTNYNVFNSINFHRINTELLAFVLIAAVTHGLKSNR